MPLYLGNSEKQKITFNNSNLKALMAMIAKTPDTPTTGIYDDEFPIEWNSLAVMEAGNVTADGLLVKISNLTPTAEELQLMTLTANGTNYPLVATPTIDSGFYGVAYGADDNEFAVFAVTQSGDYGGLIIPETGLYTYCTEENIDFAFGEDDRTVFEITPESVTAESVTITTQYSNGSTVTLLKVTDKVMTVDQIRDSAMVTRTESGEVDTLMDTIGGWCVENNWEFLCEEGEGYAIFMYAILPAILSVSDVDTVKEGFGFSDLSETGTYLYIPDSGTATYKLALPETPTGIYDDTWPIEWNSTDITGNTTLSYNPAAFKVSSLTPSAEEMETATFTLHVAVEGGTAYFNFIYGFSMLNDSGHTIVMFGNEETSWSFYFLVIPEGDEAEESGLYAYDVDEITQLEGCTVSLTLSLPAVATSYLYGHQAEATVTYNGVELPDIESVWDKSKHDKAFLVKNESNHNYILMLHSKPLFYITDGTAEGIGTMESDEPTIYYVNYFDSGIDDAWVFLSGSSVDLVDWSFQPMPFWTSNDILSLDSNNEPDGTTYLAASGFVESYPDADVIIDGVGYVGVVAASIDEVWMDKETYPYATITRDPYRGCSMLYLMSAPLFWINVVDDIYIGHNDSDAKYIICAYCANDSELSTLCDAIGITLEEATAMGLEVGKWFVADEVTNKIYGIESDFGAVWSSHDIVYYSGGEPESGERVYLAASEPVPVYE